MGFRIGVNLGGVWRSPVGFASEYDQVSTKLALNYSELGEQTVKNIAKPVRPAQGGYELMMSLCT
jgi:hypothetical protein